MAVCHCIAGLLSAVLVVLLSSTRGEAAQVLSWAELTGLLAPGALTEDFESFQVASNDTATLDETTLDHTTVTNGQGPGLVEQGVSFSVQTLTGPGSLDWLGDGAAGNSSKVLRGTGAADDFPNFQMKFSPAVQAFGMDFFPPPVFVVEVLDVDNERLFLSRSIAPPFFGFQHEPGIGAVNIGFVRSGTTTAIDNLTFGQIVPEPAAIVLALFGWIAQAVFLQRICR